MNKIEYKPLDGFVIVYLSGQRVGHIASSKYGFRYVPGDRIRLAGPWHPNMQSVKNELESIRG